MTNYFEKIYDQEYVVKTLQSQIEMNKISHAYLFCGSHGSQKLMCAKAFIKSFLNADFETASKIDNDSYPDVKIYYPLGSQTYLVKQIKDIVSDVYLAPVIADMKFYIIFDADMLNSSSANAFLKTLEEPSEKTCFILFANNEKNVLPTIVSRCQCLKFNHVAKDEAVKYIQESASCSLEDAKNSFDLFGGDIKKSIDYCLDQNMKDLYDEIIFTAKNLSVFKDKDVLEKSTDIQQKLNEISDNYKNNLDQDLVDLKDVLDKNAMSQMEDQHKRYLANKKKELLYFFVFALKYYYEKKYRENIDQISYLSKLNLLSELELNLAYNINPQFFCDVALLQLKRI